jgi:sigma-54 dependent transcriptional regulator, acetoin dehydrogenase operon transcriptional activator AcoR
MKTNIPLNFFALPWEETLDHQNMIIVEADTSLLELELELEFKEIKNLALQDDEGTFVGWIPFPKLIQTIMNQWKTTLAYYNTLLQSVDDAITAVDRDGTIVSWNPKSEEMYDCSRKDAMGKLVTDLFKEESVVLMSTMKTGQGVIRKYNQPRPNVHVLINTLPVFMGDSILGGISVERDISDVVKLNDELSTTVAYIHDLERKIGKAAADPFHKIKGRSASLHTAMDLARKVSSTDASVLITGESGVGKELFAEAIHKGSLRLDNPFIAINCGAIPAPLFESELFGYEKGAFTGAIKEGKKGKIDAAKGGTVFLDEIGEMPLDLQVKLLRVLQERQFYRVGGTTPIAIDVRVVAATNRDLEEMVKEGLFRQDLYYRLNVVSIFIPPLRERKDDIPELIQLFLKEFSVKYSKPIPKIDPEVMYSLVRYTWDGNIRELRNTMERLMILVDEEVIKPQHLPNNFRKIDKYIQKKLPEAKKENASVDSEEEQVKYALRMTYGNKSAAAQMLGISRVTLYNKIKKYNLE